MASLRHLVIDWMPGQKLIRVGNKPIGFVRELREGRFKVELGREYPGLDPFFFSFQTWLHILLLHTTYTLTWSHFLKSKSVTFLSSICWMVNTLFAMLYANWHATYFLIFFLSLLIKGIKICYKGGNDAVPIVQVGSGGSRSGTRARL